MKKKRLDIDFSYDFDLLGIISPLQGYKLAWKINNALGVKLIKENDLTITYSSGKEANFSYFSFHNEVSMLKLFKNKSVDSNPQKSLLIPEFSFYDFILLSQSGDSDKINRLHEVLRLISSVELVAFIPLNTLKSKDYFIF